MGMHEKMRQTSGVATIFILVLLNNFRDTRVLNVVPNSEYCEQAAWPVNLGSWTNRVSQLHEAWGSLLKL